MNDTGRHSHWYPNAHAWAPLPRRVLRNGCQVTRTGGKGPGGNASTENFFRLPSSGGHGKWNACGQTVHTGHGTVQRVNCAATAHPALPRNKSPLHKPLETACLDPNSSSRTDHGVRREVPHVATRTGTCRIPPPLLRSDTLRAEMEYWTPCRCGANHATIASGGLTHPPRPRVRNYQENTGGHAT